MAYGLKYTQYLERDGARLQIRVYCKDYSGASYGMANVTGAALQIIGGQSDIIAPLIKTSFSWSLVDAWDMGSTRADGTTCVNAAGEKCGRWEEFYTPDATKWKVELWATPIGGSAACIWTGFVTPDSWSEDLIYRGSVTITARDMLGALQDKEFDMTGRVTVLQLIQGALSACDCPMALQYTASHFLVNHNGTSILSHTFSAATFAEKTWYQALEGTLESLGLALRYDGANRIVLTSLRYLHVDTVSASHACGHINRSGFRQLDPALKSITETFDVDVVEAQVNDPAETQFAATGGNLTQVTTAHLDGGGTVTDTNYIPAYTLTEIGGEGWSGGLAVPRIHAVVDGGALRKIYFPTDITDAVEARWHNPRMRGGFGFSLSMDGPLLERGTVSGNTVLRPVFNSNRHKVEEITVRVEADVNGSVKYLLSDGTWSTSSSTITLTPGQEMGASDPGGVGIRIVITKITTANTLPVYFALIAPLTLNVFPFNADGIISEYKTTTNYDQANNVTITRKPVIGSASISGCVDFFDNVLAVGDQVAQDEWNWSGESSYYPLAVMIQAQVLCLYCAALSIYTGTLGDLANSWKGIAFPGVGYTYSQRNCLMLSGTFDFKSGFVAQSTLREYMTWEQVWGTFAPEYVQVNGSGRGSTSAAGSGSGSGSGSSGGGTSLAEVQAWVEAQDYATENWVYQRGYLTASDVDDDYIITALGYTPLGPTDLNGYATQQWVNNQHYLTAITASDIETALDYVPLGPNDLNGYATQTWVGNQGYATQTWVNNRGFLTGITDDMIATALGYTPLGATDLNGYATQTWVTNQHYLTGITAADIETALDYVPLAPSALNGYATQTWVGNQGYATQTWVTNRGYITGITDSMIATALGYTPLGPTDLNGYATQTWVQNRGYITGITSTDIETALGYTPIGSASLNGYYNTSNANRTDVDWSCRTLTVALDFAIGTSSDRRLKEEVRDVDGIHAIDVVRKLRPVNFDWNARAIELDGRKALRSHDVGFIAQDVRELIPEAVTKDYAGDYLRLDKTKIIPFLVAAVQQLLQEVETLKNGAR